MKIFRLDLNNACLVRSKIILDLNSAYCKLDFFDIHDICADILYYLSSLVLRMDVPSSHLVIRASKI